MPSRSCLVVALIGAIGLCGYLSNTSSLFANPPSPAQPKRGVVIVVGGVGGLDFLGMAAHWALPRAGVRHDIQEFVWTHGRGHFFKDLQDTRHFLKKAEDLAREIRRIKAVDPERPVFLLGKSGGTGLVLAAAAQLPPDTLERIILLSAAVAPDFDLRPVLRATRHELVSFYSPLDRVILGWGTSQFGTIDRFYGPSAGLRGFLVPKNLSPEDQALYDRVVQLPWEPKMIWQGHTGGHMGTSMPAFVGKEVTPWLKP
jgi:hypothetical protein